MKKVKNPIQLDCLVLCFFSLIYRKEQLRNYRSTLWTFVYSSACLYASVIGQDSNPKPWNATIVNKPAMPVAIDGIAKQYYHALLFGAEPPTGISLVNDDFPSQKEIAMVFLDTAKYRNYGSFPQLSWMPVVIDGCEGVQVTASFNDKNQLSDFWIPKRGDAWGPNLIEQWDVCSSMRQNKKAGGNFNGGKFDFIKIGIFSCDYRVKIEVQRLNRPQLHDEKPEVLTTEWQLPWDMSKILITAPGVGVGSLNVGAWEQESARGEPSQFPVLNSLKNAGDCVVAPASARKALTEKQVVFQWIGPPLPVSARLEQQRVKPTDNGETMEGVLVIKWQRWFAVKPRQK